MKSRPTVAYATATPRARRAASRPVVSVVVPTPDATPATTRRGPRVAVTGGCARGRDHGQGPGGARRPGASARGPAPGPPGPPAPATAPGTNTCRSWCGAEIGRAHV